MLAQKSLSGAYSIGRGLRWCRKSAAVSNSSMTPVDCLELSVLVVANMFSRRSANAAPWLSIQTECGAVGHCCLVYRWPVGLVKWRA